MDNLGQHGLRPMWTRDDDSLSSTHREIDKDLEQIGKKKENRILDEQFSNNDLVMKRRDEERALQKQLQAQQDKWREQDARQKELEKKQKELEHRLGDMQTSIKKQQVNLSTKLGPSVNKSVGKKTESHNAKETEQTFTKIFEGGQQSMIMTDYNKIMQFSEMPPGSEANQMDDGSNSMKTVGHSKKSVKQISLEYTLTNPKLEELVEEKDKQSKKKSERWFDTRSIEKKHEEKFEAQNKIDKIFNE